MALGITESKCVVEKGWFAKVKRASRRVMTIVRVQEPNNILNLPLCQHKALWEASQGGEELTLKTTSPKKRT